MHVFWWAELIICVANGMTCGGQHCFASPAIQNDDDYTLKKGWPGRTEIGFSRRHQSVDNDMQMRRQCGHNGI